MSSNRTWTTKQLRQALEQKGFEVEHSAHIQLRLVVDGKKQGLFIPVSHSPKIEYTFDGLLNRVKVEAGLRTNKELRRLLECPMSEEEYIQLLRERRIIKSE